ncbi:MAG: hypothetical protein ABSA83_07840 [Verrucomicrobiota bacterium]|jgi:hypothetical protein
MLTQRTIALRGQKVIEVEFGLVNGSRKRGYFKTPKDANDAIKKFERDVKAAGVWWAHTPEADRLTIQAVCQKIEEAELTLSGVWEEYQQLKNEQDAQNSDKITPTPYDEVVERWAERKRATGKSERYIMHAKADLLKFAEGQEKKPIHEFTASQLEKWLHVQKIKKPGREFGKPWGLSTKRTWMSLFHGLWDCAIDLGFAAINIVDRMEPVAQPARIKKIYTNAQTMQTLAGCLAEEATKLYLIVPVLGFFGCMRPYEILSERARERKLPKEKWFGWHFIDLDNAQISVTTDIAKKGDERVISLQPMAVEWLRFCKKLGCVIPPVGYADLSTWVFDRIGMAVEDRIRDGARHNCATHLRAIYENDYLVIRDLGNSVRTLLKDYADLLVPKSVSLDHWQITPERLEEYMKTREWKRVLREALERKANASSSSTPKPSANETGKDAH